MPRKNEMTYAQLERFLKKIGYQRLDVEGKRVYEHPVGSLIAIREFPDSAPMNSFHRAIVETELRNFTLGELPSPRTAKPRKSPTKPQPRTATAATKRTAPKTKHPSKT
jgi:hypothetical protein